MVQDRPSDWDQYSQLQDTVAPFDIAIKWLVWFPCKNQPLVAKMNSTTTTTNVFDLFSQILNK